MTHHFAIPISALLMVLIVSTYALADTVPAPLRLQQTLAGDGLQHCGALPQLRSADTHESLATLYQLNDYEAFWQDPLRLSALKSELGRLAEDGLKPVDYGFALAAFSAANTCAELRVSADYLLALEHLSRGRLTQSDYEQIWRAEDAPPPLLPPVIEIAIAGIRDGVAFAFDRARPTLPQYLALRAAYAGMDRIETDWQPVPAGPLIRPGMSDSRLGQITRRMQHGGFLSDTEIAPEYYHDALVEAVRRFQSNQGLEADGIIGPQTVHALNISPAQRLRQVELNLERLRWINAQRSHYVLLINVASSQLQLLRGDALIWEARAQTGRPSRQTPSLVSYINRITLNPGWTVPPTILREDMLPQIRSNPAYLETRNIKTLDDRGREIDPRQVDWSNPRGIVLRQPPGPTNPLGQVAFRLPNPFSIYLHDTPSQALFQRAARNVSSGCVRVEQADELARELFGELTIIQQERVADQLASGRTHEVTLTSGPQVIIAYWTAYADADGKPAFVPDSYGRDTLIEAEFE